MGQGWFVMLAIDIRWYEEGVLMVEEPNSWAKVERWLDYFLVNNQWLEKIIAVVVRKIDLDMEGIPDKVELSAGIAPRGLFSEVQTHRS